MDMDEIMNMVPRSRLRAVEDELSAAEAKTKQVQLVAAKEIHRLLARNTELEAHNDKLLQECQRLTQTIESIKADCMRGAQKMGMTAAGVLDISDRCDRALYTR